VEKLHHDCNQLILLGEYFGTHPAI